MSGAVSGAKRSVYLESYIFIDDETTQKFLELLEKKASSGIIVKIVIDMVGSFGFGSIWRKRLEDAGAEVLFFNRWFWLRRTHRKILIIDEELAFVGGVNWAGRFHQWMDIQLRVNGLAVKYLVRSFRKAYFLAGGKDRSIVSSRPWRLPRAKSAMYRAKCWLIEHWPVRGTSALKAYYLAKCSKAKKSITIVTPYFIPHKWLIVALLKAVEREVAVEVLLPVRTDIFLATAANKIFADLLQSKITFHFLPKMVHAKVLIIDEKEGMVGSHNIDAQSFDYNAEAGLVFNRKDMVGDLRKIIEQWKTSALPAEKILRDLPWYYIFLEIIVKIFRPVL